MNDQEEEPAVTRGADADELEQYFASNLRTFRELRHFSQTALADAMVKRGYPYRQQTIARIESGSRAVRLGEAMRLAEILDTHVYVLTAPVGVQKAAKELRNLTAKVDEHAFLLEEDQTRLKEDVALLERAMLAAESEGHTDTLKREILLARDALRRAYKVGGL